MLTHITPAAIHPPAANYSHAVSVPPNARWLYLSGQVGIAPDGTIPADAAAQAEICFANIAALLREAGMAPADLVRLTTYLLDPNDRAGYMAARDRFVGSPPPCSTLLIISALADPRYRIEVEAVAARA
ncbi:MAG TPA: RidA family protein [Geminicoccaceae bacterium]|nr:RidA family protein [Geminicoccaceae bacterium]